MSQVNRFTKTKRFAKKIQTSRYLRATGVFLNSLIYLFFFAEFAVKAKILLRVRNHAWLPEATCIFGMHLTGPTSSYVFCFDTKTTLIYTQVYLTVQILF